MPEHDVEKESFQPAAAILGFLLPGAGHAFLGDPRRGVLIGAGVLGLFTTGLFIGGVDVVDRKEDIWWFVGQAPAGPIAFGLDWLHQNRLKAADPPIGQTADWFDTHKPLRTKSVGHTNEVGSLFTTIAGMLNAIAIIDAGWGAPRRRRRASAGSGSGVVGSMEGPIR